MRITKDRIIFTIVISIIVIVLSSASTFATSYLYNSNEVSYDNNKSGIQSDNVQGAIDTLYQEATNYSEIRKMIYPVGSIYLSMTDDTVSKVQERFGGTWEKIEDRFLLASGSKYSIDTTGGSADASLVSHTHTFTGSAVTSSGPSANPTYKFTGTKTATEAAGSHSHNMTNYNGAVLYSQTNGQGSSPGFTYSWAYNTTYVLKTASAPNHQHNFTPSGTIAISGNTSHTHSLTAKGTNSTEGVSATGKNMPPYLTVYMYKRTS